MSERSESATEKIMSSIMDTIADNLPKQKSGHFDPGSVSDKVKNKLFGRQKTLHGVLGGGKRRRSAYRYILYVEICLVGVTDVVLSVIVAADVLLWRNKKISSSVLALATAIWVFFEWLDYHFLTIVSFALVLGMVVQFIWSNFSNMLSGYEICKTFEQYLRWHNNLKFLSTSRSPSQVPRVELPEELFVNIAIAIGAQVNKFMCFLQDVSCERNLKHFVVVSELFLGLSIYSNRYGWHIYDIVECHL